MTDSGRAAGPAAKLNTRPVGASEEETAGGAETAVQEIRPAERLEGWETRRDEGLPGGEDLRVEDWWRWKEVEEEVAFAID
jgi:hypothetical protein